MRRALCTACAPASAILGAMLTATARSVDIWEVAWPKYCRAVGEQGVCGLRGGSQGQGERRVRSERQRTAQRARALRRGALAALPLEAPASWLEAPDPDSAPQVDSPWQ